MTLLPCGQSPARKHSILLTGPAFAQKLGGLQIALTDLAQELRSRGWQVNAAIYADGETKEPESERRLRRTDFVSWLRVWLASAKRFPRLMRVWFAVPHSIRHVAHAVFRPPQFYAHASNNLYILEKMLDALPPCGIVLLCADLSTPGMTALAVARHPRVMIISLDGFAGEIAGAWWPVARWIARIWLRWDAHPYLFRRVAHNEIPPVVFASEYWRRLAVEIGLPPEKAKVVYFGIPTPEPLPRPPKPEGRLLWVGRLTPDKGLHWILYAMPEVRKHCPAAHLTVVAGPGPEDYRQEILGLLKCKGLQPAVTLHFSLERAALQRVYAEHDVLLFYSVNSEPVALVLMEAYAAGLPVVASLPPQPTRLVHDGITCLCYRPEDPVSLTKAVMCMLSDGQVRDRLAKHAKDLVWKTFTLKSMGDAYDALLTAYFS